MKFGGHETFHIRDGWLNKGLELASEEGEKGIFAENAADLAGVGANMIKSIRYWLSATGLTGKKIDTASQSNLNFSNSKDSINILELQKTILEFDPDLQSPSTWWALHINLVSNPEFAFAHDWFFNDFGVARFERSYCIENLHRFLDYSPNHRCPARSTLEKDIGVLLASYSQSLPREQISPEDTKDCPFQKLGLITFSRESGFYNAEYGLKEIPSEILGYSIVSIESEPQDSPYISYSIPELVALRSGPGRTLLLRAEELYDLAIKAEQKLGEEWIRIRGLAGNRLIEVKNVDKAEWLELALKKEHEEISLWEKQTQKKLRAV